MSAYIFLIFKSALIIIIYFPQIINAKFLRLGYHQVRKKLVSDGQLQKRNKIIETKKTWENRKGANRKWETETGEGDKRWEKGEGEMRERLGKREWMRIGEEGNERRRWEKRKGYKRKGGEWKGKREN